jgi:hypothetical protein
MTGKKAAEKVEKQQKWLKTQKLLPDDRKKGGGEG